VRAVYIISHAPSGKPEGHITRYNTLKESFPELQLAWNVEQLGGSWDLALIETISEDHKDVWDTIKDFQGTKLVHISKAQNSPVSVPDIFDLTVTTGPYEGVDGEVSGPFVQVSSEVERDIPLLLLPSWGQNDTWWRRIPPSTGCIFATDWAPKLIARATTVISAGGVSVYEALWSGCKLVCLPQNREQTTRATNAKKAGESIIISTGDIIGDIKKVSLLKSLGRREPNITEAIQKINGLLGVVI
jgi:hypothetical protein